MVRDASLVLLFQIKKIIYNQKMFQMMMIKLLQVILKILNKAKHNNIMKRQHIKNNYLEQL